MNKQPGKNLCYPCAIIFKTVKCKCLKYVTPLLSVLLKVTMAASIIVLFNSEKEGAAFNIALKFEWLNWYITISL